jgi:serine protease AprX
MIKAFLSSATGDFMVRRFVKIIIPALILLSLALSPTPVESQTTLVGVRFPAGAQQLPPSVLSEAEILIDYGSFTWTVLSPADLAKLDAVGTPYQAYPSPYALTLGGQTFDPLLAPPQSPPDLMTEPAAGGPGLHLVQFHGPTKPAWLDALQASGLETVQYIHPFTYVVWGESAAIASQASRDFVRWTGDYLPAYALQAHSQVSQGETSHVRILVYPQAGLAQTTQAIEALGGSVLGVSVGLDPTFDLLACLLPTDQVQAAAALPGVYTLQPVPTDGGNRGEMSNQVNADNLDSSNLVFPGYLNWLGWIGLSGQGVIIANVDSGLDQNHPDLVSRVLPCSGTTCGDETASGHGTHTAGIMAGDGSSGVIDSFGFLRGLGMAPGANLVEQLYSPTFTDEGGMLTLMTESYRNGAVISGNSWGPSGSPLGYDADTRWVDIGVRDADPDTPGDQPLTYVLSVMNGYGGTSSQGTPDEAKNTLSVGSTIMQYGDGRQNLNINNLSLNTAHGPALDGRQIPHLVAPGCYVDSTNHPGSGYLLRCGTSMASPHVSGAAALFFELYRHQFGVDPSPALVKAAFMPVAHGLAGNLDADGAVMGHPFDSKQGWGRLNAAAVLNFPGEVHYFDQEVVFSQTGQTWSQDIILTSPAPSLKVMLAWTDAPGHGLGGATPAWVNDLNLSIQIDGQTYYGNNFGPDGFSLPGGTPDGMNNTEGLFLADLPGGTYTLTVTAVNISGDGVPSLAGDTDQDFALAIYIEDTQPEEPWYQYIFPIFFR